MRFGMKSLAIFAVAAFAANGAYAAGDAAVGQKVFKKCAACHKVGDKARNAVGPVLNDVIGRTAGTYEGYKYSKYLKKAGEDGLVWTEEEVVKWLENPTKYLRARLGDSKARSKMSYKLKKQADRENVAAYLATLSK